MAPKRGKATESSNVWRRPARELRDEAGLSRERIVVAAIELLDAHGLDGLTMRALAERVGSGVMSLYWHVDNKEDVLDLALNAVLEYAPPDLAHAGDWRTVIIHMLLDWRASMLRHPWSAALLPRRSFGPNILARLELLGASLSAGGLAPSDLNVAIWSVWNYLMGATITRASFDISDADRADPQPDFGTHYPTIGASGLLLDNDWDGVFRRGLDFLLDGLVRR